MFFINLRERQRERNTDVREIDFTERREEGLEGGTKGE